MDGLMQTTIPQERITRDALRDLFFINFLSGSVYDSEAAIRSAAREVGLTFPHPLFLVLIARTEHWGSAFAKGEVDLRECHFILRNALENGFPGICQASNVLGEMTAIINLEALRSPALTELHNLRGRFLKYWIPNLAYLPPFQFPGSIIIWSSCRRPFRTHGMYRNTSS